MVKKLLITLGLATAILMLLFVGVVLAQGPINVDLALDQEDVRVLEVHPQDFLGESASGDINGDGIDDLILGAPSYPSSVYPDTNRGTVYVFWGSGSLPAHLNPPTDADLIIYGENAYDGLGHFIAVGDVNGDGVGDLIIGADVADVPSRQDCGKVYVILGSSTLGGIIDLSQEGIAADVTIYGNDAGDRLGRAVASGDVNGDGVDDIVMGAYYASNQAGAVYVIYGSSTITGTPVIDLDSATADVTIYGADEGNPGDRLGRSVATGDVNGDGYADIIAGAQYGDPPGTRADAGETYVIYGSSSLPSTINLPGGANVLLNGVLSNDQSGFYVTSGDLNGDSYDEIIIGAYIADTVAGEDAGAAYVVYGGTNLSSTIELSPTAGVTIYGAAAGDRLSRSMSTGDVNGDGFDDLIIGASQADRDGRTNTGKAYVIYGGTNLASTLYLSETTGADIFVLGNRAGDEAGRAAASGDVNGDNVHDIILGATLANEAGEAYVIYGPKATTITLEPASTVITGGLSVAYTVTATNAYSQSYDATNYLTNYSIDGAAGGSWSGNVYTTGNDGTWTVTATHRGLTDTAELLVDGTAPVITEVNVTSDNESYFHNPGLTTEGGTVYFNSRAGEGAGQTLTVVVTMTEANPVSLTGGTAFGTTPPADTNGADGWTISYNVGIAPGNQTGVPFTVTDIVWLTDQAAIDFIEDNVAPTGGVTAPTGPYVNETQPAFTANANDATSGVASVLFQYKLSSAGTYTDLSTDTASPYQAVWGSEALADGQTYNLRVVVTDNVGNVYTSEVVTVTCDLTAPQSSASSPDYDNAGPIAVDWTASDATSGIAQVLLYVRAGGGSWADSGLPAQSGTSGTFNYTPPADGTYYFQTVVTDNAGNREAVPSGSTGTGDDSTIYDTTDPTGSVTAPSGAYVSSAQPAFTANANDATSGVASVLFQYKLSSAGTYTDISTDTSAPYQAEWGSQALADGQTYNLRVIVTDNAGNDYTSAMVTVTCDLSMPTMEPIVETEGQYYNSAPVFSNFGFDDNEDLDDGWYQMDSYTGTWTVLFTDVSGPSWDNDGWRIPGFDALSEGSHTIYFRASDDAGNEVGSGGEWSWQFYKDTTPPTMETISEPQGQYYNSAPVFSNFGFDDEQALDAGWYQLDSYSGSWVPLFAAQTGTEWNEDGWQLPSFDSLSEGSHTVYFRARDDAGNEEGESGEWSWQFYKDTTAPTITYTSPTAGGATTWYTADPGAVIDVDFGVAGGSDLDYAQYRVGTGAWQTIFSTNRSADYTDTWAVNWSLLAEGENQISIRVADVAGNLVTHTYSAGSSGFLFRKDSLPPYINTVTVNSNKSNYFYNPGLTADGGTIYFNSVNGQGGGQVLTVGVTMTEANPLRLDGGTAFGSTPSDTNGADGWSVSYAVAAGAGSANGVMFTVTDQGGHTDTATINFIQDNAAPAATVVTPTGTLTSIGIIQGTAADNSGGAGLSKVEVQVTDGTKYLQTDGSWSTSATWLTPSGLENWSYNTSGVTWAEVSYTIRVRTTDRVGNIGTNESTFTYEAPAGPMWYIYLPIVLRNY
ncbi:MAG: FG-GAP-like repeat-containing protein [Anaerolineae bacterium]|nr:FG-GAP-like repeat-containing protein [Anaerolineae bacterium]MDH7475518.1 FG-GAP-like repeat-containing protein [Anaerolineae bacterium]